MTVAELIASREPDWRELEELVRELNRPSFRRRASPDSVARFTSLYRAVCSDLAVAESYHFPSSTISRLNELAGLAHNCLYRRKSTRNYSYWELFFFDAPRWILTDVVFWITLLLFWGSFLIAFYLGKYSPDFAADYVGVAAIQGVVDMYNRDYNPDFFDRLPMVAFYIAHNGGIGLKAFAFGILGAIPGAFILLSNALQLGTIEGYMYSSFCPEIARAHFIEFTTAHSPFELTAIVLSAAAGMRMGFGLVMTRGYTRLDSLRRATIKAAPTMALGFILFCFAGCIEAFVSPLSMKWLDGTWLTPLGFKRCIAVLSTFLLILYFFGFGTASILRHYRGLSFKQQLRTFWTSASDVEISRVQLDRKVDREKERF